jgi:hypothetical protein
MITPLREVISTAYFPKQYRTLFPFRVTQISAQEHGGTQISTFTHLGAAQQLHGSQHAQGSFTLTIMGTAHGAILRQSRYLTHSNSSHPPAGTGIGIASGIKAGPGAGGTDWGS